MSERGKTITVWAVIILVIILVLSLIRLTIALRNKAAKDNKEELVWIDKTIKVNET